MITIWVFFFQDPYLSGLDYGLVSVRRAYYQLLRRFSSVLIPLAISVENRVLEIAGLES
jgi:hypothetical protein